MPTTRTVPAIAVPSDEPRLDTLRDSPEISPCCRSPKLDWTMFTDGVSIVPTPSPISSRPGSSAHTLGDTLSRPRNTATPASVRTNPATTRVRWASRLASGSAAVDDASRPTVAAVKITPVSMAS